MQQPNQPKSAFKTILTAGLLAGTLDITTALVLYAVRTGKNPLLVCRYIASAVFGKEAAYSGGNGMVAAGFVLHYIIAFIFTIVFFLLYPKIHVFIKNKFAAGILYGLFVWIVMNLLVVPLTRIPSFHLTLSNAVQNIIILMLAIGLPVSLIVHQYYYGKTK
jgi:hypothetical protein